MKKEIDIQNSLLEKCTRQSIPLDRVVNEALSIYFIMVESVNELLNSKKNQVISSGDYSTLVQSEVRPEYKKDTKQQSSTPIFNPFDDVDDDIPF